MTRLVVEAVHRISGRPWALVTGVLEGELRVGDSVTVADGVAIIRSVEFHAPPGRTTVAIDREAAGKVAPGDVITSPFTPGR